MHLLKDAKQGNIFPGFFLLVLFQKDKEQKYNCCFDGVKKKKPEYPSNGQAMIVGGSLGSIKKSDI